MSFARSLVLLAIAASPLAAQTGTLRGRVIDGAGAAVANVTVQAQVSAQTSGSATTAADGAYSLTLPAGTYTIVARRLGFTSQRIDAVQVRSGGVRELNITMSTVAVSLNQVVVTATPAAGGGEKMLDAPAHVGVVTAVEVEERPSLSVADHIKGQPGVDVSHGGLVQANIVSRGFNNAFSGSMLVLQDNRFSSVPSLRVNVPFLSPSVNEDIERIEVLLGPAAALYGPNSANGVLHVITKSPFTSQGGTVTIDAGERSVIRGAARYAGVFGDKIGYKISGEMMRGDDWEYRDPAEPATIMRPDGTGNITAGVGNRVSTPNVRDFEINKAAGEARVDLRVRPGLEWMNTVGMTRAGNYLEITGANGAAQARNWNYLTAQSRVKWNRTFAQIFYNASDAGNEDSLDTDGTFLLRTGTPIVDKSSVLTAQLQQAFDFGTRQSFVVGGDYIGTSPETGGTINGRNEAIDDVTEFGGYVHSVTRFNDKWEFVSALRLDSHSEQEDMFFSPRAALVFKPTENQNLRLTYNRAFSTPANFSFFLDLPQGRIPIGTNFYTIRALGVPETGFYYPKNSATGVGGLYMRSIFPVLTNGAATIAVAPQTRIDADAAQMYRALVGGNQAAFVAALLAAGVAPGNVAQVFGALMGANSPTPAQLGTTLRLFSPSGVGTPAGPYATIMQPADLLDLGRLKSTISNTYEVGYKGILEDRVRLALNGWFEQKDNFTTPAVSVTPNAFMNSAQLGALIGGRLAAEAAAGRVPAAAVATLTTNFTTTLASIPVGTIMLEQPGVTPDAGLTNRSDLIFTYRNVDQLIEYYGADMAIDVMATNEVTIAGTYGWISQTEFTNIPSGTGPLRINAPAHKASLAAKYRNETSGWSGELRGRYTDAFAVNSGVYIGQVPVNALLDASVSYRIPKMGRGAMVSLSATNLLDERVPTFIGVPRVGRLIMTRLQYNF